MTGSSLLGRKVTWIAATGLALVDQVSKVFFVRFLEPGRSVAIIPGFLDLTLVTNTGGVFGIMRELDGPLRGVLFGLLPLLAIVLMVWYARSLDPSRTWPLAAIGLILGGAAGNLVDRIRLGYVIDFLDAYVGRYHWPAFNLADSGICVGVAMLLLESLIFHKAGDGARPVTPSPPSS